MSGRRMSTNPSIGTEQKRKKFSLTRLTYESTQSSNSILSTGSDSTTWGQSIEVEQSGEICVQLQELNKDADSSFEFVCGVNDILCSTVPVNIMLVIFGFNAVIEAGFGLSHLENCPIEPRISLYLFVGGCFAALKILHMLYTNYRRRKHSMYVETGNGNIQRTVEIVDAVLNIFLLTWQIMGGYWFLNVWWPHSHPPLHEPNNWCHGGVYIYTFVQLTLATVVIAGRVIFQCGLMVCYSCTNVFESQEI